MDIDKDVPIPPIQRGAGKKLTYPWPSMEVGDSVGFDTYYKAKKAHSSAREWGLRNNAAFSIRQTEEGGRVWRVK